MATQQLDTMAGQVVETDRYDGRVIKVKLAGRGNDWINLSRPEYRQQPFEEPNELDAVKLGVSRGKNGQLYAATCEIQHRASPASLNDGQVLASGKDLSITRSVALKAAAEIVAARAHGFVDNVPEMETHRLSADTLALAQDFEEWMLRDNAENVIPFS